MGKDLEMNRNELLAEIARVEAAVSGAPAAGQRTGAMSDLLLELQYIQRAATPSH